MPADPLAVLARLDEIEARAKTATAGPWYPRATDDDHASNARYVGLSPGPSGDPLAHDGECGMDDHSPASGVVAITLLQNPPLTSEDKYDENTLFIASARTDVPALLAAVRALVAERDAAYRAGAEADRRMVAEACRLAGHDAVAAFLSGAALPLPEPPTEVTDAGPE